MCHEFRERNRRKLWTICHHFFFKRHHSFFAGQVQVRLWQLNFAHHSDSWLMKLKSWMKQKKSLNKLTCQLYSSIVTLCWELAVALVVKIDATCCQVGQVQNHKTIFRQQIETTQKILCTTFEKITWFFPGEFASEASFDSVFEKNIQKSGFIFFVSEASWYC